MGAASPGIGIGLGDSLPRGPQRGLRSPVTAKVDLGLAVLPLRPLLRRSSAQRPCLKHGTSTLVLMNQVRPTSGVGSNVCRRPRRKSQSLDRLFIGLRPRKRWQLLSFTQKPLSPLDLFSRLLKCLSTGCNCVANFRVVQRWISWGETRFFVLRFFFLLAHGIRDCLRLT
jgi:hypothetical protein